MINRGEKSGGYTEKKPRVTRNFNLKDGIENGS